MPSRWCCTALQLLEVGLLVLAATRWRERAHRPLTDLREHRISRGETDTVSALPAFEPDLVMTEAEYLSLEDAAETKHEFADGHVYDWPGYDYDVEGIVGARFRHNVLQVNLVASLAAPARAAGCQVVGSDMRLRIHQQHTRRYYYPDAMILCDREEIRDNDDATQVSRPCVVFEILSARSMRIDHVEKLQIYRAVTSVQEYVIVEQRERRVERYWRGADNVWQDTTITSGYVPLACIDFNLAVEVLYAGID